MKRTIGWFIAAVMAAPACAQVPRAPEAAPAPPAAEAPPPPPAIDATGSVSGGSGFVLVQKPGSPPSISSGTIKIDTNGSGGWSSPATVTILGDDDPNNRLHTFQGYMNTIGQYSQANRDATTTAIAAVMQADEMLRSRGAQAEIDYFNKVLGKTDNERVKRAIRLCLIDAYKRAGQSDKALDELKTLILEAPEHAK